MKKLCNGTGKRIHPSPPPSPSPFDLLVALPAAVLTLASALSPEEREVLAYLLSAGGAGNALSLQSKLAGKKNRHLGSHHRRQIHPPDISCGCFSCYKSFWARWDASPNRHLIHRILDAVEEPTEPQQPPTVHPRRRRRRRCSAKGLIGEKGENPLAAESDFVEEKGNLANDDGEEGVYPEEEEGEETNGEATAGDTRSPMRRLVSYIGERVLGVWN
ncbi:hypothetical protein HPP92_002635 [Vanilla planifolia]|uniref:Uncharacterized protein n=1 Tax=Vanilla planifolia TaxID=51239 RepID=A0A835SF30_VANPL|nr:hypothetical protein HPP92_002635 [Vanilla planifolia]